MKLSKIKKISIILSLAIIFSIVSGSFLPVKSYAKEESKPIESILSQTKDYMIENKEGFSDTWAIIGLSRYGAKDIDKISEIYLTSLKKELNEKKGKLTTSKYTDFSKAILTLTALGIDPRNIEGYNLLENLSDINKLSIQGINGPLWALIALDSNDYTSLVSRQTLINYILANEIKGGGWSLSSDIADVDVTAMVLTSLSKYKDREDVKPYIERALDFLSKVQNEDGGFITLGVLNSESVSQIIIALTSLQIDPLTDARFIKNGKTTMDNLIENYYNGKGGFLHTKETGLNKISTDQGFLALVSYIRFKEKELSLYDMTDMEITIEINQEKNEEQIENKFVDIEDDLEKLAIIELNKLGIIQGVTQTEFKPNNSISRAEVATLIARALNKEKSHNHGFSDVKKSEWFSGYIGASKELGLISGYPDNTFKPYENITRQEVAKIIYNIAKMSKINVAMEEIEIRNYLSQFPDYLDIGSWSMLEMGFSVKKAYIPNQIIYIEARRAATRSEVAGMLYRLLKDI